MIMATVPRVRRNNLEEGRKYMNWSFLVLEGIMKAWVAVISFGGRHLYLGRYDMEGGNLLLRSNSLYTHFLK